MKITTIKIINVKASENKLVGIASFVIDDMLAVHDLKILQGEERLFIAMPSKKTKFGFKDIIHPINAETRNVLEKIIIELYKDCLDRDEVYAVYRADDSFTVDFTQQLTSDFKLVESADAFEEKDSV